MCSARKGRKEWPAKPKCNVHPCFRRGRLGPSPAGLLGQKLHRWVHPFNLLPFFRELPGLQVHDMRVREHFGREVKILPADLFGRPQPFLQLTRRKTVSARGIGPAPAGLWRAGVQQRERLQERLVDSCGQPLNELHSYRKTHCLNARLCSVARLVKKAAAKPSVIAGSSSV